MATAIVSTAAERYGLHPLSLGLVLVAGIQYVWLLAACAAIVARFRPEAQAWWADPRSAFGLLTFVAGSTVLGERLDELRLVVPALLLVAVGILSWMLLGYAVQLKVMLTAGKPPAVRAMDGSWLLWVVATQSLATAAAMIAVHEAELRTAAAVLAVCAWAVGALLYVVLITIIFARLLLFDVAAADLEPSYWIAMGATAITVLAGARILNLHGSAVVAHARGTVQGVSLMLWAFGSWMLPFLVAVGLWRHAGHRLPITYDVALWSVVFPLGMYATASAEFGGADGLPFMTAAGRAAAYVAIAAWLAVCALWGRSLVVRAEVTLCTPTSC
jgi:tellurite resistance protein TehA-like permease